MMTWLAHGHKGPQIDSKRLPDQGALILVVGRARRSWAIPKID